MKTLLLSNTKKETYNRPKTLALLGIFVPIASYIILVSFGKNTLISFFNLHSTMEKIIVSKILIWTILFLTIIYSEFIEKRKFIEWTDSKRNVLFYIKIIVLGILLFAIVGIGSNMLLKYIGFSSKTAEDLSGFIHQYPIFIFVSSITAGIVEELVFRGYMMTRWYSISNNKYVSVTVSSLIFAAAHYSYGTVFMLVQPFLFGLIFALLYFKYKNIKVLIFIHILWDILIQYLY